jgi:two-component system, OmpR family, sensor kinase
LASVLSRFDWRAAELGKTVSAAPAGALLVEADPIRLQQALGNFVDNALRYGGDEVTLQAARNDGRIELHVQDNGAGFPPEFLERAFDRFSRADAARSSGGAGLGLSIVKAIAESHDGSAHVANRGHGGADSWISLPFRTG